MSLVELRQATRSDAVSGGAMDKVIERRTIDKRILIAGATAVAFVLILLFWLFAPSAGSMAARFSTRTSASKT